MKDKGIKAPPTWEVKQRADGMWDIWEAVDGGFSSRELAEKVVEEWKAEHRRVWGS